MTYARDPVSVHFDAAAAAHLRRAFSSRGEWVSAWIPNPSREWEQWAGANAWPRLRSRDNAPGGRAQTVWCRAYIRACHNLHRKFMTRHGLDLADTPRPKGTRPPWALDYRVANRLAELAGPGAGGIVARRVDLRLLTQAEAQKFAAKLPERERWVTDDGPGPRYAGWDYHG